MNFTHHSIKNWVKIDTIVYPKNATLKERRHMKANAKDISVFRFQYIPSTGVMVVGYAIVPKRQSKKPLPVILYARGGTRDFGRISHYLLFTTLADIAKWGYVLLATDYRDTGDEFGGEDLADVLYLKKIAKVFPGCDAKRIGLLGVSRGGMMVYCALAKVSWVNAAVVIAGLSNLPRAQSQRPKTKRLFKKLFGGSVKEQKRRSAVFWTNTFAKRTPLMMIHGLKDNRVNPLDSLELSEKLYKAGRQHRLIIFENGTHYLEEHEDEYKSLIRDWFARYI